MVEQPRPWVELRYTDTSKSAATGNRWWTAIDLSIIERSSRKAVNNPEQPVARRLDSLL
jgi:hypothetical protein